MMLLQPKSIYEESDILLFRLRTIIESSTRKVFRLVYQLGLKQKPDNISIFEYLEQEGNNRGKNGSTLVAKFRKTLNPEQIKKIENYPDGSIFDVSLLFRCIQWVCTGIAYNNEAKWKANDESLECYLDLEKERRNKYFHPDSVITNFSSTTEEIESNLCKTLDLALVRYSSYISEEEIQKKKDEVKSEIKEFINAPIMHRYHEYYIEQGSYVLSEGRKILCACYEKWLSVTPPSLFCKHKFEVKDIYTNLSLLYDTGLGTDEEVPYENILKDAANNKNSLILIEGWFGMGKTTFVKKIITDWVSANNTMELLNSYSLLFYMECKNHTNKTFKDLIVNLMPKMLESLLDDDLVQYVLSQRIIVIIDGFDELNESQDMFKDVMNYKKSYDITVITTTRSGEVETYYGLTADFNTKHYKVNGITKKVRKEFVEKYYNAMLTEKPISIINACKEKLNEFLRNKGDRLDELLRSPYNLALLTVLFIDGKVSVDTTTELYWEIFQLCCKKLENHLISRVGSKRDEIRSGINHVIKVLSHEALILLKNNGQYLSVKSCKRLKDVCKEQKIPVEEITNIFLKRSEMLYSEEVKYSFPHKGNQEFLGAYYLFKEATSKIESKDVTSVVMQDIEKILVDNNVSIEKREIILDCTYKTLGRNYESESLMENILITLPGTVPLVKKNFVNVFSMLIGLFYMKKDKVKDHIKLEVLKLLNDSGVKDKKHWLKILDSVKCDEYVAKFIYEQCNILEENSNIDIEDGNIFGYISLLNHVQMAFPEKKVKINLEQSSGFQQLMEILNRLDIKVHTLQLQYDFKHPARIHESKNKELIKIIRECLQSNTIENYRGAATSEMKFPMSIRSLHVSVHRVDCYEPLRQLFEAKPLEYLHVCVSSTVSATSLDSLPAAKWYCPDLYIADVNSSTISNACEIAKKLQPNNGQGKYDQIYFPRANLSFGEIFELIRQMKGVSISSSFVFPPACKPDSPEEADAIQNEALNIFNLKCVKWGGSKMHDQESWMTLHEY